MILAFGVIANWRRYLYVAAGQAEKDNNQHHSDAMAIVAFDVNGNILWQKHHGKEASERRYSRCYSIQSKMAICSLVTPKTRKLANTMLW